MWSRCTVGQAESRYGRELGYVHRFLFLFFSPGVLSGNGFE